MASSPSCSSSTTSPTASSAAHVADLHETSDVFSDDSGVDVKPRPRKEDVSSSCAELSSLSRRNKRKSSEPKKRKDVLLMKRFRWDTDEEDVLRDEEDEEEEEDAFDALEGEERPGSGDSGCQLMETPHPQPGGKCPEKKRRPRTWRKPVVAIKEEEEDNEDSLPAFRQSVIRKNESTTTSTTSCTSTASLSATTTTSGGTIDKDYADLLLGRSGGNSPGGRPRNYKSMSRQRRIEANARERTRVHTISAAFESLRRAVPAYAHNQKLSKLAILRIASAYIVALACLNDAGGGPAPSMADCVDRCTRTIQAEGRSRRRTSKE